MAKNKLFKFSCIIVFVAGLVLACVGLFLRAATGKYKYISADEKNAYVTNIDLKTEPISIYIRYDYEPDRYIVARLKNSEYDSTLQECDWVSIYYNVDEPKNISMKNPHTKANLFMIFGGVFTILGATGFVLSVRNIKNNI